MITVLAMAGVLWGIGAIMGAPKQARLTMIGLLLVAVLALQVLLPEGHPLREATGGSPQLWLLIVGIGALVWGYSRVLGRVRGRARAGEAAATEAGARAPRADGTMGATELDRYARHIMLREIGGPGQTALRRARVLVVGAGGLGAPVLQYLAAAGVGTIGVIDPDEVANSNLQRQVIHTDDTIGMPKVFSAQAAMERLNPFVTVRPYHRALNDGIAEELFGDYDLVLDGSDNFATRYLVNRTAVATGTPLIAAALTQWEGQISLYDPARGGPCYACIFPKAPAPDLVPSCAEAGVLGPLPGVVGAMMAVEAVKAITGAGEGLMGRLLIYDALYGETRIMKLSRRPDCPVCAAPGRGG